MAKVFRDKRSTKICKNIFYTYRGYQDIDFITKIYIIYRLFTV